MYIYARSTLLVVVCVFFFPVQSALLAVGRGAREPVAWVVSESRHG